MHRKGDGKNGAAARALWDTELDWRGKALARRSSSRLWRVPPPEHGIVEEGPAEYTIRLQLPENLKEGCLQVELDEGFVSVSVERPWSDLIAGHPEDGWFSVRGPAHRVPLPPGVDHSRARLQFREDQIEILVPKEEPIDRFPEREDPYE